MTSRSSPFPARVWVTRAQPQADATAARLRERGFEAVVAPVLEICYRTDVAIDLANIDALAFTSAAGVTAFAGLSSERNLTAFAVGDATARAAREAGFTDVRSAHGHALALANSIAAAEPRPRQVLNPTAADPAADLPALLAARGITARAMAVYKTLVITPPTAPDDLDIVLIHSAKAAGAVALALAERDLSAVTMLALSPAAAAPLATLPFHRAETASAPNEAALLGLLPR